MSCVCVCVCFFSSVHHRSKSPLCPQCRMGLTPWPTPLLLIVVSLVTSSLCTGVGGASLGKQTNQQINKKRGVVFKLSCYVRVVLQVAPCCVLCSACARRGPGTHHSRFTTRPGRLTATSCTFSESLPTCRPTHRSGEPRLAVATPPFCRFEGLLDGLLVTLCLRCCCCRATTSPGWAASCRAWPI